MALERGTEEFELFGEYFKLCKKYWDVKDTDEYWKELVQAVKDFPKKYNNDDFAVALAIAFVNTQSKRHKQKFRKE